MTANIHNFISALGETVRPNQYQVQIIASGKLQQLLNINSNSGLITCMCKSAVIPQSTVGQVDLYYRGRPYHEAGEVQYQPWTASFYNTIKTDAASTAASTNAENTNGNNPLAQNRGSNEMVIRDFFEKWMYFISHRNDIGGEADPSLYKCDVLVTQLTRNGESVRTYRLVGAWPQDVGQIQLSYESNDQVEEFDATFVYDYFVVESTARRDLFGTQEQVVDDKHDDGMAGNGAHGAR